MLLGVATVGRESKFKEGDRVRNCDRVIEKARRFWEERKYTSYATSAWNWYQRDRDRRGTVTWAGWNGYCMAVEIRWDDGMTSKCMDSEVTLVPLNQDFMEALC
jgi:hypothetical protein